MAVVEILLLAGLGIWWAAGCAYALGIRLSLPGLVWAFRFRALVRWEVFGANARGSASTSTYRFEIRDSAGTQEPGWKTAAEGHAGWSWHGFLWQPQRRLADSLRRCAKILSGSDQSPGATTERHVAEAIVRDFLARVSPPALGQNREIRLVVRHFSAQAGSAGAAPVESPAPAPGAERIVAFSRESHDASGH